MQRYPICGGTRRCRLRERLHPQRALERALPDLDHLFSLALLGAPGQTSALLPLGRARGRERVSSSAGSVRGGRLCSRLGGLCGSRRRHRRQLSRLLPCVRERARALCVIQVLGLAQAGAGAGRATAAATATATATATGDCCRPRAGSHGLCKAAQRRRAVRRGEASAKAATRWVARGWQRKPAMPRRRRMRAGRA